MSDYGNYKPAYDLNGSMFIIASYIYTQLVSSVMCSSPSYIIKNQRYICLVKYTIPCDCIL